MIDITKDGRQILITDPDAGSTRPARAALTFQKEPGRVGLGAALLSGLGVFLVAAYLGPLIPGPGPWPALLCCSVVAAGVWFGGIWVHRRVAVRVLSTGTDLDELVRRVYRDKKNPNAIGLGVHHMVTEEEAHEVHRLLWDTAAAGELTPAVIEEVITLGDGILGPATQRQRQQEQDVISRLRAGRATPRHLPERVETAGLIPEIGGQGNSMGEPESEDGLRLLRPPADPRMD